MMLNDISVNYKSFSIAIKNADRKLKGEVIAYSDDKIKELNTEYKFIKISFKEILTEALNNDTTVLTTNHLLYLLEEFPEAQKAFDKALTLGEIKFNSETQKYNFIMSPPEIWDFLKTGGFNKWKKLTFYAESNNYPILQSIGSSKPTENSRKIVEKYYPNKTLTKH